MPTINFIAVPTSLCLSMLVAQLLNNGVVIIERVRYIQLIVDVNFLYRLRDIIIIIIYGPTHSVFVVPVNFIGLLYLSRLWQVHRYSLFNIFESKLWMIFFKCRHNIDEISVNFKTTTENLLEGIPYLKVITILYNNSIISLGT